MNILNKRLTDWSEEHGNINCSPAQAGFRPKLSTAHHLFTLQHVIDRARMQGAATKQAYKAAPYMQKADDTVQHM